MPNFILSRFINLFLSYLILKSSFFKYFFITNDLLAYKNKNKNYIKNIIIKLFMIL